MTCELLGAVIVSGAVPMATLPAADEITSLEPTAAVHIDWCIPTGREESAAVEQVEAAVGPPRRRRQGNLCRSP